MKILTKMDPKKRQKMIKIYRFLSKNGGPKKVKKVAFLRPRPGGAFCTFFEKFDADNSFVCRLRTTFEKVQKCHFSGINRIKGGVLLFLQKRARKSQNLRTPKTPKKLTGHKFLTPLFFLLHFNQHNTMKINL